MINTNRIVPVEKTDLISLYGLILLQASGNSGLAKLASLDVAGDYQVTSNNAKYICDQPVKSVDIDATTSSVSASTIYFVPAYDYVGFSIDGTAVETAGVDVDPANGGQLYSATLSSGTITIAQVGF